LLEAEEPRRLPGLFCIRGLNVSGNGEEGYRREGEIKGRHWDPRPGEGTLGEGAAISDCRVQDEGRQGAEEERVEVEGCAEIAVEQGGNGPGGAAAGALHAEELVDGAGWEEARVGIEVKGGEQDDRHRQGGVGDVSWTRDQRPPAR
jgi:hypothetical protein